MLNNTLPATSENAQLKNNNYFPTRSLMMSALIIIIFISTGGLIYSNSINAPFYFDDFQNIVNDPYIRLTRINWDSISNLCQSRGFTINRPISTFTFALNYYFGQYDVTGYHIINMLIHTITAMLLFLMVRTTCQLYNRLKSPVTSKSLPANLIAFFTALLWLVNPLHTESVTYIVQRMNSLAAMLYVLSLLLYVQGRLTQNRSGASSVKTYLFFTGCLFSGLMAVSSKEIAATLPFFILLFEWFFLQTAKSIWTKRRLILVSSVIAIFIIISILYLGKTPLDKILFRYEKLGLTIIQRILTELRVVIYYLNLIIFPHPDRLNFYYDYPISNSLLNPPTTFLSLMVIIFLIGFAVIKAKKDRLVSFCILWFFGNLAIESSFIGLALIYEHRLYLPSMMISMLLVILLFRYINRLWLISAILCGLIILFSIWTNHRNAVWTDNELLWQDSVKKSPNDYRAVNFLGNVLLFKEKYDEALKNFFKFYEKYPNSMEANFSLGNVYASLGQPDNAILYYQQAIKFTSEQTKQKDKIFYNLGMTLLAEKKIDEAIKIFNKALLINPDNHQVMYNMGNALLQSHRTDDAIRYYEKTLEVAPHLKEIHNNIGNALMQKNMFNEAIPHFKVILKENPNNVETNINMGVALVGINDFDSAIIHFQNAIKKAPENAEVQNNLGVLFLKQGQYNRAKIHFEAAIKIRPDYASARSNLNNLRIMMNSQNLKKPPN
jgi:tetratricopeptide (TPR) repeat protein